MSHLTSVSHHNISPINEAAREGVWFVCFLFNEKKKNCVSVIKEKILKHYTTTLQLLAA